MTAVRKKGDRSSFPMPSARAIKLRGKNGPIPFSGRGGFTLFELILAIALSAALLALIGAAINLYLTRVDASRARVEEAQLARSILAMIADDIRATTIYKPQDTSAIAKLMANGTPFDVDSIDDQRADSSGATTGAGAASSGGAGSSFGSSGTSAISSTESSSSTASTSSESESTMPLGLSGTLNELYVDVTRLPRREELFGTITGYTNAPSPMEAGGMTTTASVVAPTAGVMPPSDLKTVRYFIRQGEQVAPGSVAATSLAPDLQSRAGGLVRQEIARQLRLSAEETGDSALLDSGQALIAPEVVHLEFRYYDGEQTTEVWDMVDEKSLPLAVDVTIWLVSSDAPESAGPTNNAREYRQTVFLPMAAFSQAGAGTGSGESSSSGSSSSSSGSSFGQP